jgi:hypothetical protein
MCWIQHCITLNPKSVGKHGCGGYPLPVPVIYPCSPPSSLSSSSGEKSEEPAKMSGLMLHGVGVLEPPAAHPPAAQVRARLEGRCKWQHGHVWSSCVPCSRSLWLLHALIASFVGRGWPLLVRGAARRRAARPRSARALQTFLSLAVFQEA